MSRKGSPNPNTTEAYALEQEALTHLESLLAVVQRRPEIRVIVFYEQEYLPQFEILRARLPVHQALAFPVDEAGVRACLLAADNGI